MKKSKEMFLEMRLLEINKQQKELLINTKYVKMSLSNPTKKNPCKKWIEWKSGERKFYYYDKSKEVNVFFDNPIFMVVLDELSCIKGFHDSSQSSIYSNEVRYIDKEALKVKAFKGGNITQGIYSQIKGNLQGGKYCKSVYVAIITGDKNSYNLELANIAFYGASVGVWIDASVKTDTGNVIMLGPANKDDVLKKGTNNYWIPVIKKEVVRDDILQDSISLDMELQEYLAHYLSAEKSKVVDDVESKKQTATEKTNESDLNNIDDLPF